MSVNKVILESDYFYTIVITLYLLYLIRLGLG